MKPIEPWLGEDRQIPLLLEEWGKLEQEVKKLFADRNNEGALQPMKVGIDLLLQFVFWSNKLPVGNLEELNSDNILIKPVNVIERIQFILQRPNLYPSFVQLSELFTEQTKQYSKMKAVNEAKRLQ